MLPRKLYKIFRSAILQNTCQLQRERYQWWYLVIVTFEKNNTLTKRSRQFLKVVRPSLQYTLIRGYISKESFLSSSFIESLLLENLIVYWTFFASFFLAYNFSSKNRLLGFIFFLKVNLWTDNILSRDVFSNSLCASVDWSFAEFSVDRSSKKLDFLDFYFQKAATLRYMNENLHAYTAISLQMISYKVTWRHICYFQQCFNKCLISKCFQPYLI